MIPTGVGIAGRCGPGREAGALGDRGGQNRAGGPSAGAAEPAPDGLSLRLRGLALGLLRWAYPVGLAIGTAVLLPIGGFVPVLAGWLDDRVRGWSGVVEALGGVPVRAVAGNPDADHGPVLGRADAPLLFDEIAGLSRRLGVKPPGQVRLTYLPCCGVVSWGRGAEGRALLVGLPLLSVLDRGELRAVLAHELAHLARGDATGAARSARFVEGLGQALDAADRPSRGPLRPWARACHGVGVALLAPIARGQEARADRFAAGVAGGDATASALVKVALIQPLFREVLAQYDPTTPGLPSLYATFRTFWRRLPDPLLTAMRHRLLTLPPTRLDAAHPALIDRLAAVQPYPARPPADGDRDPAESVLGDPQALERMLHNRLFGLAPAVEPTLFHRAGS